MNAEFQWWLLILGIVIGGALVYLVLADVQGDEIADNEDDELDASAALETGEDSLTGAATGTAGGRPPRSVGDDADVQGAGPEPETPIADAR